jgi:ribosomal subunit interface protein
MVDINITGVRYEISDKVRAYVHEKLQHATRIHPSLSKVHVTIHEGEKFGYRVDVEMHLPQGKDVVAHDSEETVYGAIDIVSDKCAAQLRKIHDKAAGHHRHSDRHRVH